MPQRPDEPEEELGASAGLTMALAPDACLDDRPSAATSDSPQHVAAADDIIPPGEVLRRQREQRGLSLDDLWRSTKINKTTLSALEASDVLRLPAPIYTRGFVKAYAREVGLDPDQTANEYLRAIQPVRNQSLPPVDNPLAMGRGPRRVDTPHDARSLLAANQVRRFSRVTFALAAFGLVFYLISFSRQTTPPADSTDSMEPAGAAASAQPGESPQSASAKASDDGASALSSEAALENAPLTVVLMPRAECWISARVDGERVIAKLLQPGDRETLAITDEAVLRIGEPGALSMSFNGQMGRPLGRAGQPITVRITKGNYRDFLSS